jgi:hypothetical protein
VLPSDQKESSSMFLAFVGAALLCVVLAIVWSGGFAGGAFTLALLAFSVGSAQALGPRLRRGVYATAVTAGAAALVGDVLIAVGLETAGAIIVIVTLFAAAALLWTVRLG